MAEQHLTARVPELPENLESFSIDDLMILYVAATNKTTKVKLGSLLQYLALGGSNGNGGSVPPASADKGRYTFDVTQEQIDAGGDKLTIYLPQFAGKNFTLRMDFRDLLDEEYAVLNLGGFRLTIPGVEEIVAGTRFRLDFSEKIAGGIPAGTGSLFSDKLVVTVNTVMSTADTGKIIQFRAGATPVSLTLTDMLSLPMYTPVLIESTIGNTVQHTVQTQMDQLIYMNNKTYARLHIGPGESLWLYKDVDGYFAFDNFAQIYRGIGIPQPVWEIGDHQLLLDGSTYNRADYPRLWEYVQTLGESLVTDSKWLTPFAISPNGTLIANPHRGKWSTGDGTTTFRVPDFLGMYIRGLKSASDPDRIDTVSGSFQPSAFANHNHTFGLPHDNGAGIGNMQSLNDTSGSDEGYVEGYATDTTGGTETRTDNIGMLWVVNY